MKQHSDLRQAVPKCVLHMPLVFIPHALYVLHVSFLCDHSSAIGPRLEPSLNPMKMISSLIYSLFITPFFLAVASAQMTTTAVAGQVTGVSTKLAAGTQASSTAPPTTGTISATLPASASADAAAASAAASISDAAAASAAYAAATSAFATSGNYTDACGPTIPDPTVEDSCDTPVEQVDSPAAYGVQCLNDTQTTAAINITSCSILIPEMCSNQWQRPGEWLWLTANGCSIGSFLPPVSFVGAAPWPSSAQCEELIFASMVDECEYSGLPYNIAAVNLKILPTDQGNVKGTLPPHKSTCIYIFHHDCY